MRPTDSSLVRGCLAGDRQSWETLVRRYERLLYRMALSAGLSTDDAADLFQTVCLKLLQNLDKLCDDKHLTGWLITTTKHEVWRILRQNRRKVVSPEAGDDASEQALSSLSAPDPLPEETVLRLEEEHLVRAAMQRLGESCRVLLELLYRTDPAPPYTEIARRLNVSTGAIGPTRARCLQKLKKILVQMGF